jgi:hypothetical protein
MKDLSKACDDLDREVFTDLDDLFCGCRGAIAPLEELSDGDTDGRHPAAGRVEDDQVALNLDDDLDDDLDELGAGDLEVDLGL